MWDTRSHRLMQDYNIGKQINSVHFHPSGNYLAVGTNLTTNNSSVIKFYDIRQGRSLFELATGEATDILSIRFSQGDGDHFVAGGSDGLAYLWNTTIFNSEMELQQKAQKVNKRTENITSNGKNGAQANEELGVTLNINNNQSYNEENPMECMQQRAMEELSVKLEGFVSKINGISDSILKMEQRITNNEFNTKKLINFLETTTIINNNSYSTREPTDLQDNINTQGILKLPFDSLTNSRYCAEGKYNYT